MRRIDLNPMMESWHGEVVQVSPIRYLQKDRFGPADSMYA